MNQAIQKQVLDALLNLYMEASTSDGFNPNLEGPEDEAEKGALAALQAAGLLNEDGNYIQPVIHSLSSNAFPPSQKRVQEIKGQYPAGTRIRLDEMPNDPAPVPKGTYGTVVGADDAGQLQMKWDNGRTLAIICGVDKFTVLTISLEDFVATKKFVNDIEKATNSDNGTPDLKGYVYKDHFYIEQLEDGRFCLPLGNEEFIADANELHRLEDILYNAHFGY